MTQVYKKLRPEHERDAQLQFPLLKNILKEDDFLSSAAPQSPLLHVQVLPSHS